MNLYSNSQFGKDRVQWTKCVITYLSEYFEQCQLEEAPSSSSASSSSFYFNWITFLTELLDKSTNNPQYQQCVFICLSSLVSFVSFSDIKAWTFINEELMAVIVRYINTSLWQEALDLIKLTVSKSSSLSSFAASPSFFLGPQDSSQQQQQAQPSQLFFSKKELPGRTLEFDFDFKMFVPSQVVNALPLVAATPPLGKSKSQQQKAPEPQKQVVAVPPLNLLDFGKETVPSQQMYNVSGWKRPYLSQSRTRERIFLLLNTLNKNNAPVGKMVNTPVSIGDRQSEESVKPLRDNLSVSFGNILKVLSF